MACACDFGRGPDVGEYSLPSGITETKTVPSRPTFDGSAAGMMGTVKQLLVLTCRSVLHPYIQLCKRFRVE